ncbi:MAG: AGE family epimerase/isomerase [Verrucomicrobiales bacterium]|nr:AGE family epimerase/isomerase [Verrucomicrobiales bacterium]
MRRPFSPVCVPRRVPCLLAAGLAVAGLTLLPDTTAADGFADLSAAYREQLSTKVLPYWYDTAIDWQRGGYVLADDGQGHRGDAKEKQIVTQARMVWGFSVAQEQGWSSARRDYLKAAEHGYRFLLAKFRDADRGGYFWSTDLDGNLLNDRKNLYGMSFVVYAFVEYFRAGGEQPALDHALELYRAIQDHCHDAVHGGWGEHYTRDWQLVTAQDDQVVVELAGKKSANSHLHWMEALSELYEATRDPGVRRSLEEALEINRTWFYPMDAARAAFHREFNWARATGPRSEGLSYGHNVEFAWLMVRAERVLGREPSWAHFEAHLDHALKCGFDHERGGIFYTGAGNDPATNRDKVWWSQSEWVAALTDALRHEENPAYRMALSKTLEFLDRHQIDPADGIWYDTVAEDGSPKRPSKAHNWKANYHDVRGLVKFIEAFGG